MAAERSISISILVGGGMIAVTEKIFDDFVLGRLAVAIEDAQQEQVEGSDLESSSAQDEAICRAYQESGGDPAAAKRQLTVAEGQCKQAFGRVVQFIADQYGFGSLEQMSDATLKNLTQDGLEVCANWAVFVDAHEVSSVDFNPLRLLLDAYHAAEKSERDMHAEIFWPVVKRVSRLGRPKQPR